MSRLTGLAGAALALAVGVAAAPAAVSAAVPTPAPGPKQPIEHLGISGAHFFVRSGKPGCFTGSGQLGAGFAVPRGAMVTGATLYVIDSSATAQVFGELTRHDFTTGGTFNLKTGGSGAAATTTKTVELAVDPGYVMTAATGINLFVNVGSGTCFKGAEVHFIRNPEAGTSAAVSEGAQVQGRAQDAALR